MATINLTKDHGPVTSIAREIHAAKYRGVNETFYEYASRVAGALSDSDEHRHKLKEALLEQRLLPAGRVQLGAGSPKEVTLFNCLSGSTKVLTRELGLVPIEQLNGEIVTLLDANGHWVASTISSFGTQELFTIRFTNGKKTLSVKATANHRWIMSAGTEKITETLVRNDRVPYILPDKTSKTEDYKKGVIHGLVYGDGSAATFNFHYRVCSDHEDVESYLAGCHKTYPKSCNGDPIYYFKKKEWPDLKSLPSIEESDQYLLGFIRGWLAADGCVSDQPEVTICGDYAEYEWLTNVGATVGFETTGYSTLSEETNYGTRNKKSLNIRFALRSISKQDLLIKRKADRLEYGEESNWRVDSISPSEPEVVYCADVPTTHSFVLEKGLLTGNCFVSGVIEDDSVSILGKNTEAFLTLRTGGGIGYDFSRIRPRGTLIRSLGVEASGPLNFMDIFDATCAAAMSAGHRRGAQMAVLRVDHPDIEAFIRSKQNETRLKNFNISIGITDEFMQAVIDDTEFDLKFEGKAYGSVRAAKLWDEIMRSTWDWAEPGVLFLDTINRKNNLWYCETIEATNPCAEQPLPPYGACLLGSINLTKYVERNNYTSWDGTRGYHFNMAKFVADVPVFVRALDNVVDQSLYPLPEQRTEAINKRRMGIGVTGLANALEIMGFSYGSPEANATAEVILKQLRDSVYDASIELAKEKGPFPLFNADLYCESQFIKTLPKYLIDRIREHGIRNSHLLSIAPTGTISLASDNVSSGIEPPYQLEYMRHLQLNFEEAQVEVVKDYAWNFYGVKGKTANETTAKEHVDMLTLASKYVDSAVSKTCNVGDDVTWEQFKDIYMDAWKGGASGCTTFREQGKRFGVLRSIPAETEIDLEGSACFIDPETGRKTCE